ncbi:MAG: diguanylate cyclase [Acidimicrobiia bacterium]
MADATPAEGEALFRALVEHSIDMLFLIDAQGRYAYVSPAGEALFGYPQSALIGEARVDLVHPDDLAAAEQAFAESCRAPFAVVPYEWRAIAADRSIRHVEGAYLNLLSVPGVHGIVGSSRDITTRKATEAERTRAERRWERFAEVSSDAIWTVGSDGLIRYASPASPRILGWTPEELVGEDVLDFVDDDYRTTFGEAAMTLLKNEDVSEAPLLRMRTAGGDALWVTAGFALLTLDDGGESEMLITIRNIHRHKTEADAAEAAAQTDPLTGLSNRLGFERRVRRLVNEGLTFTIAFCDLNDFKFINDHYGHAAGDHVLRQVAERIQTSVRPTDLTARFGGDEFVVAFIGANDEDRATMACVRMMAAVNDVTSFEGIELPISISVGAVVVNEPGTLADWLATADHAMYQAKRSTDRTVPRIVTPELRS